MSKTIVLCGCGWLGKYAAERLIAEGNQVIGTTRSQDKADALSQRQVTPVLFSLGDDPKILFDTAPDVLILNVPPGRKKALDPSFIDNMKILIASAISAGVKHTIFVSTTSVYGAISQGDVTEDTALSPNTASGEAHQAIEAFLQSQTQQFDILRLSGLVGPDRHPINTLAGRTLENGNQVTNLVHVEDVVSALKTMINLGPSSSAYLLSSLAQPKRADYYVYCAEQKGLPVPQFSGYSTEQSPAGKRIVSDKSWEKLGLTPKYASPYDMI